MNVLLFNYSANSSFFDVIYLYWNTINVYLVDTILILRDNKDINLLSAFDSLPDSLYFDDFQYYLFKIFIFILLANLALIFVAWKVYGKHICERFMKPATNKAIEELKASVSKLKLPKEHTPRI